MKYFLAGLFAISFLYAQSEKKIHLFDSGNEELVFHVEKNRKIQNVNILTDDSLTFRSDGLIDSITRHTKTNVYNITLPKKTTFYFSRKGMTYYSNDKEEYLVSCKFTSTVVVNGFPCTKEIIWFPNGKIHKFVLAKPYEVGGYCCDAKSVEIFENGKIASCTLRKKTRIDGYLCSARRIVKFFKDGKIASCILARETRVDGYLCAAERIEFSENSQLIRFTLAEDKLINSILFHKGSVITLGSNGKILSCRVSKTTKIKNFLVGTYVRDEIEFYSNGQVKSFGLLKPAVIDGYFCRGGYVTFHPNGKLKYATLVTPQKIKGLHCEANDISFYSNGHVKTCYLAKEKMQNGISGFAHSGFYLNGNFKYTRMAKNIKIKNIFLHIGDAVILNDKGTLTYYFLEKEREIFGKKFKKGTGFYLYKDGKIKSIVLQQTMRIQNYLCRSHQQIDFYKNGNLKTCILAETVKINNRSFLYGTQLYFYENGKFKNFQSPQKYKIATKYFVPTKYKKIIIPDNVNVREFVQMCYK